ncbi:MAG: response regulator transcription factor [Armatimonadota bacterium]
MRILVVDDQPAMVSLITDALTRAGFSVVSAEDGEQGLRAVEEHHPDLVILDLAMPVMTGLQVLRTLRARPETSNLPVIVLTGRDGAADMLDCWMGGVDRYLVKPCSMGELISVVQQMLAAPARQ